MREGLLSGVMLRVQPAEPMYAPYQVLFTAATDVSCETGALFVCVCVCVCVFICDNTFRVGADLFPFVCPSVCL